MPSTYAHRRFGADVLNALDPETASLVTDRRLYDIGLHGRVGTGAGTLQNPMLPPVPLGYSHSPAPMLHGPTPVRDLVISLLAVQHNP